jgi:hypothetical protein
MHETRHFVNMTTFGCKIRRKEASKRDKSNPAHKKLLEILFYGSVTWVPCHHT